MSKRRDFLRKLGVSGSLLGLGIFSSCNKNSSSDSKLDSNKKGKFPLIISTWNNHEANLTAWNTLENGGSLLDAIEKGIHIPENNPNDNSVGYGGRPDREGIVTLDACIMDADGNAGSVTFISGYKNPISVARRVMEKTPHVMLSGTGAEQFALEEGFEKVDLLTEKTIEELEVWLKDSNYAPKINSELHDTIGMIGIDKNQNLAGGCSTSGLGYKMRGRVGDSPIIGAGLFVDNEIGAATATGLGELVMKTVGSFLVVELMRNGLSPEQACKKAVERISSKYDVKESQVGFIALNKSGQYGGYALQKGFQYVVNSSQETELFHASFDVK
jgi:N4-(beta-N-acetylglucosaminyl)-L-asparaginase